MHCCALTDRRWSPSMVLACLLVVIATADAYSKFGRSCKDIGCLSQETCVMAHESCSYSQRDGKDCGSYPTCKRNPNGGSGSVQDQHNPIYNQNPGPPIDPNNIFGSPNGHGISSGATYNNQPVFPIRGAPAAYPQPYPQIPQHQPMPQYPYGGVPGVAAPSYVPQQPYAFGNPPPPRNYPTYYVTTTKEPSLWNQFLYNKQGGKKNGAAHTAATATLFLATGLGLLLGRSMSL